MNVSKDKQAISEFPFASVRKQVFFGFGDTDKNAPTEKNSVTDYNVNKDIDHVIFAGSSEDLQGAMNEINEAMKET